MAPPNQQVVEGTCNSTADSLTRNQNSIINLGSDPDGLVIRFSFYSGIGSSSFVGTGYQLSGGSFNSQVIPVPEPETYATALLLFLAAGWWHLRWCWVQR